MIIREDGPILKYRRWMKQFYTNPEYRAEMNKNEEAMKENEFAN